MSAATRRYATIECATEGCTTTFTKTGGRHKYCEECAKERKLEYMRRWYYEGGGQKKSQTYYVEHRDKYLERAKRPEVRARQLEKSRTPEAKMKQQRVGAESVQLKRERRIAEELAGGRRFRRRDAPVSYQYLEGTAKYTAEEAKENRNDSTVDRGTGGTHTEELPGEQGGTEEFVQPS